VGAELDVPSVLLLLLGLALALPLPGRLFDNRDQIDNDTLSREIVCRNDGAPNPYSWERW